MADGTVYKRCICRDPETDRLLGSRCPELRKLKHGSLDLPVPPQGRQAAARRRLPYPERSTSGDAAGAHGPARASPQAPEEPAIRTGAWPLFWLAEKENAEGASAAGRKVAASTARSYRAHLELYLLPALGDIVLRELTPRHISGLFRELETAQDDRPRPMSAATMRRVYATLRSALNAAVRQQKIDRNPALMIDLASGARPKAMVWTAERVSVWRRTGRRPSAVLVWTPEQTGAFLDSAEADPLYALYHLIALRGLRRGEAVGLSWSDVDIDGGWLLVREQLVVLGWRTVRTTPKAGSERVLALDEGTVQVLREHRRRQEGELRFLGRDPADTPEIFTRADG